MPQGAAAIKSIFLAALLWPTCSLAECAEVLLQMAGDMTRPHDAVPSGVPDAYDWQTVPRLGMGNDPANFTAFIAWGQVYTQAGVSLAANTRVELGPMRALILRPSAEQWTEMHPVSIVQGAAYREDFGGDASVAADTRLEPDGNLSVRLIAGHNFHFWPESGRVALGLAGVAGVVISMPARLILDDPAKADDRASARLMVSVGADYWQALDAAWPNNGDVGIGRFAVLTPDWQEFTMTTLDAATLCAHPPPL